MPHKETSCLPIKDWSIVSIEDLLVHVPAEPGPGPRHAPHPTAQVGRHVVVVSAEDLVHGAQHSAPVPTRTGNIWIKILVCKMLESTGF